jgi:ubiquinone/menaquinone biosynthesis C-methylase UbiE
MNTPQKITNDDERICREKEWHNKVNRNTRAAMTKYYAVSNNDLKECITEQVTPETTVLLDYGCGYGDKLIALASRLKKGIGIDISDARVEEAKKKTCEKGITNIDFFVMDAMNMTFGDNEFDIIIGDAILHHLNLEKSLCEIKRVLKRNGKAYFTEPLATNLVIQLYRKLTPKMRTVDEQPFRRRELRFIKSIFLTAKIEYIGCFTLLAVPFRNLKNFDRIMALLRKIDRFFLCERSPFKYLAWTCALTLEK